MNKKKEIRENKLHVLGNKIIRLEKEKYKLMDKLYEIDEMYASEIFELVNDESFIRG